MPIRPNDREAFEAWNKVIQTQLLDSKVVTKACILNRLTGQVWGTTEGFGPCEYFYETEDSKQNELQSLTQICRLNTTTGTTAHCIRINKQKYQILRRQETTDSIVIYGKSFQSKCPLCVFVTSKSIILAIGKSETAPADLNSTVETFGTYLQSIAG